MPVADREALRGSFDPKKSLITSILTGCIPGVISGINKYRQAMCQWLLCYKINVAYGSMTAYQCDELFKFTVCKYVLGEVWNVIPFYQYASQMNKLINDFLANPIMVVPYAIDTACSKFCTSGNAGWTGGGCAVCSFIKFANTLSGIAGSIFGLVQQFKVKGEQDLCKEAVKKEPDYGNIAGFPKEQDPKAITEQGEDAQQQEAAA